MTTLPSTQEALAACPTPWCAKSRPQHVNGAVKGSNRLRCITCGVETPPFPTRAEAIAAWNTRPATDTDTAMVERIAKFVEDWNGKTRAGDTFLIADEIRKQFASSTPVGEVAGPSSNLVTNEMLRALGHADPIHRVSEGMLEFLSLGVAFSHEGSSYIFAGCDKDSTTDGNGKTYRVVYGWSPQTLRSALKAALSANPTPTPADHSRGGEDAEEATASAYHTACVDGWNDRGSDDPFHEDAIREGFMQWKADHPELLTPTAPLPESAGEPPAWIVGSGDGKRFRTWQSGMPEWTEDREKSTRYSRREDAEAVHREDEDAWTVTPYIETPPELTAANSTPVDRDIEGLVEQKWSAISFAPKGVPTESVGCRGSSDWFLGLHRSGAEIEIRRRPWPQDDGWADREETYYTPESFTHWKHLALQSPAPVQGDRGELVSALSDIADDHAAAGHHWKANRVREAADALTADAALIASLQERVDELTEFARFVLDHLNADTFLGDVPDEAHDRARSLLKERGQ